MKPRTLTKTKLKKFKEIFLEKKNALLSNPTLSGVVVEGGDDIDVVQGNVINEMIEKLSTRGKQSLQKITEALRRIEDGTFGLCEECEEPISDKRLTAIPDCTTCISCAEEQERQARHYRKM